MHGRLVVEIARDSMSVAVTVYTDGKTQITRNLIMQELSNRGINTGIQEQKINELLHYEIYRKRWIVAKGVPAVKGKDGWYEFMFDKDFKEMKPKIREDGSVDYSPNIQIVNKGDKVMTYHPPVPGKNGITVFGSTIAPIASKDAKKLSLSKVEQRGNDFYAKEGGRIALKGNCLEVMSRLEINGNAGYATGMINFIGDVIVDGDIKDGVTMEIGGNLEVCGEMDAVQIKVSGDIICHGGIHGKEKAKISAGGTVTANFIEEADIYAGGDVQAGHIINAKVVSENNVVVEGRNGTILGGEVQADESISAVRVGNEKGCNTILRILSTDVWGREYARIVVQDKVFPYTQVEINGVTDTDCRLQQGELHLTSKGLERYEIGSYVYKDVLAELETQSDLQMAEEFKEEHHLVKEKNPDEKKLILVVDDDPLFLKTQYTYLVSDYYVAVVSSGADALKFLEKNKPDLILLDYLMPEMDGSELLLRIRSMKNEKADIPVFFLTSVTDKKVIMKCLSLYPQKYLMKPLEKDELLQIIGDFFAKEQK